jgi:hypothetical protein
MFLKLIEMIKVIENSNSIFYGGCTNLKPKVNVIRNGINND